MVAPQLRLSGKGSVSFLFSQRLLFSDPTVPMSRRTDARNAALKTASGPAGENWAKLANTHTHNYIMHGHAYKTHCTLAILHFSRKSQHNTLHK